MRDVLFKQPLDKIHPFSFNQEVSQVFDDMVERSVPFYSEALRMCAELTQRFHQTNSNIYDLGCSTGNLIPLLLHEFGQSPFHYIGVDSSSEMLSRARERYQDKAGISFQEQEIQRAISKI